MSHIRPRLSVVIPTHDTSALTARCLETVLREGEKLTAGALQVIVVDDASSDDTSSMVRSRFPGVELRRVEAAGGFTHSVNLGLEGARGETCLLLNSDTELEDGSLQNLLDTFEHHPALGILGARLHYPDKTKQWSGAREPGRLWLFLIASGLVVGWRRKKLPGESAPHGETDVTPVDWVAGAALSMRREVLEALGHLDEGYRFFCQDLDFCSRARAHGFGVAIAEGVHVLHHLGGSSTDSSGTSSANRSKTERLPHLASSRGALLIEDLARWATKHRGPAFARSTVRVLELGLWARWSLGSRGGDLDIDRETARSALARAASRIAESS